MITGSLLIEDFTISGISLSSAQSPPPITFPALADAISVECSFWYKSKLKKESRKLLVIISEHALLAL